MSENMPNQSPGGPAGPPETDLPARRLAVSVSDNVPGQPPGGSAGPAGRGTPPYPLLIALVVVAVVALMLAIALWAGYAAR